MKITGECFCAKVKYQVNSPLRGARTCHCSRCRKAFSSHASAYAQVDKHDFTWLCSEELLTTYLSKYGFGLQFCSQFGSTLCGTFNGDIHGVALGCVNGDPHIALVRHIYVGSKALWEIIPEGIPQYQ